MVRCHSLRKADSSRTGIDQFDPYRRAAFWNVDRILKGEKPGDLPVQAPIKFRFLINLKTAKARELTCRSRCKRAPTVDRQEVMQRPLLSQSGHQHPLPGYWIRAVTMSPPEPSGWNMRRREFIAALGGAALHAAGARGAAAGDAGDWVPRPHIV